MSGHRGWLLGLLVAQLLLIGGLLLLRDSAEAAPEKLLPFDPASVRSLTLEQGPEPEAVSENVPEAGPAAGADADTEATRVALERTADGWQVANRPADAGKVHALLAELAALGPGWPVAQTTEARARFGVGDDDFRKRLTVETEDATLVLLLGTSPGFKRLHGRRGGARAIYSVALADFDLPATVNDWLDKALLALPAGEVETVARADHWQLRRAGDNSAAGRWQASAAAGDTPLPVADDKVERWLDRLRDLRVLSVLEDEVPEAIVDRFELSVAGSRYDYALFFEEASDRYSIARADVDGRFEIASYIAEQLQSTLTDLQPDPPAAQPSDSEASTQGAPVVPESRDPAPAD